MGMLELAKMAFEGKSNIEIAKKVLGKLFDNENNRYNCKDNVAIIIKRRPDGVMTIETFLMAENVIARVIPDKEAEQILMK